MKQHILYRISLVLGVALCLFACNEEDFVDTTTRELTSLELYTSSVSTRSGLLDDGTTVIWHEDDELAVYDYEAPKHRFVAGNVNGPSAQFIGKITAKKDDFLALYPYELGAENLSANNEIVVTLPQEQTAQESTFAPNLNVSVAKGARNVDGSPSSITFYNVCQLLKFTVPDYAAGKIKQIQFAANTPVAGTLYVDYSGDMPTAAIASDAARNITVVPSTGSETFGAGTYYIVSAPVVLDGFTMSFTCDNTTYTLGSSSTFGGQAGKVYNLGSIDLVNTPQVTAKHQYTDGLLQGTLLTVANPPIVDGEWKAVVKNAAGTIVRTMQGVGTLTSSEQDENWPYLLRDNYTLEYTFTSSNGKEIVKTMSFNLNEVPQLSVSVSAYTSYSYYIGDGVSKDISAANRCNNVTIYAPKIAINGIASHILSNANYSFVVTNNFGGIQSSVSEGIYSYNDYTVNNYTAYTLTGNVVFDGITRSGSKMVYITGLPYTAQPPTQSDWGGSAQKWESDYVRLHKHTISKTFYCPANINVKVGQIASARQHTLSTTYKLICSGSTLKTLTTSWMSTVEDNGTYDSELKAGDPTVKCENSYGSADAIIEGTHAKVRTITVRYR